MDKKIVSLLPSITEIVCKLGFRDNLMGVSHECDYPNSIVGLPVLTKPNFYTTGSSSEIDNRVHEILKKGLSVYDVDEDLLRKLSPEIIITQTQCEACAVSLREVEEIVKKWTGNQVTILSLEPNTLNDVWDDFERVANVCDSPESFSKINTEITERFKFIENNLKAIKQKPTVLSIEWIDPIMVAGNWIPELVELAGGESLLGKSGVNSHVILWDEIIKSNPDVIIFMPCGFNIKRTLEEISLIKAKPGWSELKAVELERVFVVDGNQYFNRPGPRLIESVEILAEILHEKYFEKKYTKNTSIVSKI